ncbi:unnamed protein product [Pleuronectes platessa]|uniref:Uncharacterized protein n=1 Tax=Pleuronectes platessa TaxID=8262 RepID=A0A9N7VI63_PLEPL|nr:unnamed protein product [Pleuronectes platessa]
MDEKRATSAETSGGRPRPFVCVADAYPCVQVSEQVLNNNRHLDPCFSNASLLLLWRGKQTVPMKMKMKTKADPSFSLKEEQSCLEVETSKIINRDNERHLRDSVKIQAKKDLKVLNEEEEADVEEEIEIATVVKCRRKRSSAVPPVVSSVDTSVPEERWMTQRETEREMDGRTSEEQLIGRSPRDRMRGDESEREREREREGAGGKVAVDRRVSSRVSNNFNNDDDDTRRTNYNLHSPPPLVAGGLVAWWLAAPGVKLPQLSACVYGSGFTGLVLKFSSRVSSTHLVSERPLSGFQLHRGSEVLFPRHGGVTKTFHGCGATRP